MSNFKQYSSKKETFGIEPDLKCILFSNDWTVVMKIYNLQYIIDRNEFLHENYEWFKIFCALTHRNWQTNAITLDMLSSRTSEECYLSNLINLNLLYHHSWVQIPGHDHSINTTRLSQMPFLEINGENFIGSRLFHLKAIVKINLCLT